MFFLTEPTSVSQGIIISSFFITSFVIDRQIHYTYKFLYLQLPSLCHRIPFEHPFRNAFQGVSGWYNQEYISPFILLDSNNLLTGYLFFSWLHQSFLFKYCISHNITQELTSEWMIVTNSREYVFCLIRSASSGMQINIPVEMWNMYLEKMFLIW